MSEGDHSEIIRRLQEGDPSALKQIFTEVVPLLWPLLAGRFRRSLSHEDMEDVVAASLSKLWRNRDRFDFAKGDFHGWFYVILRNSALDLLRRRASKVEEFLTIAPSSERPDATEIDKEHALNSAVAALSEREQQVLLPLFDRSDVSIAQLGESLSLSPGAVRQLRFRALRKLEKSLASSGYAIRRVRAGLADGGEGTGGST